MPKATTSDHSVDEFLSAAQTALHEGDVSRALLFYQSALSLDPGHGMANYWLGVLALKSSSFPEAATCLEVAAKKHPDFPDFQLDLGLAYQALHQIALAETCFEAARRNAPGYGQAQLNFAISFEGENRLNEAVEACKRGLVLYPCDLDLLRKLADLHARNSDWPEALQIWKQILAIKPNCASSSFVFGETCYRAGELELAESAFQRAVELQPDFLNARLNLGLILQKTGKTEAALECFLKASALNPGNSEIHKGLGDLYRELKRWPDAVSSWQIAVDLHPNYADAWQNLGLGLECQDRLDEALACHERVVQIRQNDPNALRYLGMACQDLGRLEDARTCYRKALELAPKDPEIHWQIFSLQASLGEFPKAWDEHEWRWQIKGRTTPKRDFTQPMWTGDSIDGKTLLLHAEQGFGDTIQAVRYVPLIREQGGKVLLWCPPDLTSLLETVSGVERVISQMKPDYAFDTHLPMMSLPHVFQTRLETIPARVPYLRAPADAKISFPDEAGRNPKIGLVWCGSLSQPNDRRPIPFEILAPLVQMTGIDFFSLQKGNHGLSSQSESWKERITDLSSQLTDFAHTAAAIENLDLLITIDTAVAHLAGALGKPVWLLLPFTPDWRWMLDREDNPWYPTMRLFRQQSCGDWNGVLEKLCATLSGWTAKWHWSATLNSWLGRGLVHHQSGRLDQAEEFYRLVLERNPEHSDASRFMGVLCRQRGDLESASMWVEKALKSKPSSAQVHHDLGLIKFELGRMTDAIGSYRRAIDIQPDFPEAHYHLGNAYYAEKLSNDAKDAYHRAVEQEPSMAEAYYNLGLLTHEEGKIDLATEHYEMVLRLEPSHTNALLNLGIAYKDKARIEEAERCFRRLLKSGSFNASARVNLASVLTSKGEPEAAEQLCLEVLSAEPKLTEAWMNLGVIRQALGKVSTAIEAFGQALEIMPSYEDARYNLGIAQLLLGDFESGWKNYESRWLSSVPVFAKRRFNMPLWQGENLQGRTLLVHAEQGFGDTIQFVRYAIRMARQGTKVVLECPSQLTGLLSTAEGVDQVVPTDSPLPKCDFYVPLMSLPFRTNTTLQTIPDDVPYLRVPDHTKFQLPTTSKSGIKVGLVWSGNPQHGADRARSIPFHLLSPLWSAPGVTFYSLQVGSTNQVLSHDRTNLPIINLEPHLTDFAVTAAAIRDLDLVICADTAVAHLSGALGKPVWVLLPFAPDWRWLREQPTSPWYPSARLFRQQKSGDWSPVIETALAELSRFEKGR